VSKYYVNKFLYTVDRDPEWVRLYKEDPAGCVEKWEKEVGPWINAVEESTVVSFTEDERRALVEHDYVALFEMGAHFFLNLTLFIALYDEEYAEKYGPLSFQKEMARRLSHWSGKDYPSVAV
jgi:hypothetical protein